MSKATLELIEELERQQTLLEQNIIENLQTRYHIGIISQDDYDTYKLDYQIIDRIAIGEDRNFDVFYRVISKNKQDDRVLWEDTHIGHRYCISCLTEYKKLHKLKDCSKYQYCSEHLYNSPLYRKKRKLKYQKQKLAKQD